MTEIFFKWIYCALKIFQIIIKLFDICDQLETLLFIFNIN